MSLTDIRLNPELDPSALASAYARDGFVQIRVQIRDIFDPETAQEINTLLREKVDWRLIYADPDKGIVQLTRAEADRLGQDEMQRRMAQVMQRATRNYGYCYSGYQMTNARRDGVDDGHPR